MNTRRPVDLVDAAYERWRFGAPAQIPGWGSLYTELGSTLITNLSTPNTLPADASQGIFLAPQATVPVTGSAWGLLVKYNCIGVYQMSDFTILNQRINSTDPGYVVKYSQANFSTTDSLESAHFWYAPEDRTSPIPEGPSINTLSQLEEIGHVPNIFAFADVGLSTNIHQLSWSDGNGYALQEDQSHVHNGLEQVDTLEFILWQLMHSDVIGVRPTADVEDPIPGLEEEHFEPVSEIGMRAIGVQCNSSSVTGNAEINSLTGTFSNFSRADPVADELTYVYRLGLGMPAILLPANKSTQEGDPWLYDSVSVPETEYPGVTYYLMGTGIEWLPQLFAAGGMPRELEMSDFLEYPRLMRRADLLRALQEAYKHYALQLMFHSQENRQGEWLHPTLNPALPWPLISNGDGLPALVVLVLLSLWAFGCITLTLAYGTRRRYAATFDMSSFYKFCRVRQIDPEEIINMS